MFLLLLILSFLKYWFLRFLRLLALIFIFIKEILKSPKKVHLEKFSAFGAFVVFLYFIFVFGAFAQSIGDQATFKLERTYDYELKSTRVASLVYISKNAQYFVANDQTYNLLDIQNLAKEFEEVIYPKFAEIFGFRSEDLQEALPFKIVFTKMNKDIAGYFDNNEIRNEIFLNSDNLANFNQIKVYLTHELQHLLSAYLKDKKFNTIDEVWLNELRSEYVPTLIGYYDNYPNNLLSLRVKQFLSDPYNSFYPWKNSPSNYGAVALFGHYLIDLLGPKSLKQMFQIDKTGVGLLNELAKTNGFENGSILFHNFAIANIINDKSIFGGIYSYKNQNLNFKISPQLEINNIANSEIIIDSFDFTAVAIKPIDKKVILQVSCDDSCDDLIYASLILYQSSQPVSLSTKKITKNNQQYFILPDFNEVSNSVLVLSSAVESKSSRKIILSFQDKKTDSFFINQTALPIIKQDTQPSFKISGSGFLEPQIIFSSNLNNKNAIITSSGKNEIIFIFPQLQEGKYDLQIKNLDGQTITLPEALTVVRNLPDMSIVKDKNGKEFILKDNLLLPAAPKMKKLYNKEIINLSEIELSFYKITNLVKAAQDLKVYEIDKYGIRHWLKMTPEKFILSGRKWEDIFELTKEQLNFYPLGKPQLE